MIQHFFEKRHYCLPLLTLIIFSLVPFFAKTSLVLLLTELAVNVLLAMAYNITLGVTGMFSFGHGGLFGTGAYILAIAMVHGKIPMLYALILAPFLTAALAFLIGWFCIRLTGIYFSILTLAFGQLIWVALWKMRSITGGDDGLTGLKIPAFISSPTAQYFFILALAVVGIVLIRMIVESPFGFTLKTIRENEKRAQAIGINVKRYQLLAFTISGLFTGLAGAMYAIFQRGAFVEFASISKAFDPVFAGVLGGMYVFWGPTFGAAIMLILDKFVGTLTEYWPLVAGCILVLLVLFLPEGIVGRAQKVWLRMQAMTTAKN